ncbi:uncharacterized protein Dana_GF26590, partial [Drosophila ananassae]
YLCGINCCCREYCPTKFCKFPQPRKSSDDVTDCVGLHVKHFGCFLVGLAL